MFAIESTVKGPYRSVWCDAPHYIVRWTDPINGPHWVVVAKGEQPADAHLTFATLREARAWMAENGFTR